MVSIKITEDLFSGKFILLVEKCHHLFIGHFQFPEGIIYHTHLVFHLRIGSIHHMQNDIRVFCFLQGTFKCLDQVMGQLPNKANGIRQIDSGSPGKLQHSGCRVQCGKQFVLRKDPGICQCIQKGRLTRIGIPYNSGCHDTVPFPALAQKLPVALHLLKLPL